jgi:hypothetical protein
MIWKFNVKTWDTKVWIGVNLLGTDASGVYFNTATDLEIYKDDRKFLIPVHTYQVVRDNLIP